MAASDTLDQWLKKSNEASSILGGASAGLDAGTQKLKTDLNYDAKLKDAEDANNQVLETRRQLRKLKDNVNQNLGGRLVTQAQADTIEQSQRDPLTRQLGDFSESASTAQNSVSNLDKRLQEYKQNYLDDINRRVTAAQGEAKSLYDLYGIQNADELRKYQEQLDKQSKLDDQAFQLKLANLYKPVNPVSNYSNTKLGGGNQDLEVEVPDAPVTGSGIGKVVQSAFTPSDDPLQITNFYGNIQKKMNEKPWWDVVGKAQTGWDETFGRILNNR